MKTALELVMQAIITAGWNNQSDGDVESPTGHFAIVERPAHPGELNDILNAIEDSTEQDERDAFSALTVGFYGVTETEQGNVYIDGPHSREKATQWFEEQANAFDMWANTELHGL